MATGISLDVSKGMWKADLAALDQTVSYFTALNDDHNLAPACSYLTQAHGRDNPDMPMV